ncbi:hypothetical protein GALMADRAFT_217228 [Galerina marginata CBS 339.88]|uniref:Uncharacterized protein n=1 Tax=Galerina marginata (strain CBS 339.88) TaxID=685588 RepID=A0A067S5E5_GALM3|nr:hypothetical protein GALMADRAFT_217228 [Galerina marginata CBS 339.88]
MNIIPLPRNTTPLWDQTLTAAQKQLLESELMWDVKTVLTDFSVMRVQLRTEALLVHPLARPIQVDYVSSTLLPTIRHGFDIASPFCIALPLPTDFPAPPYGSPPDTVFCIDTVEWPTLAVLNGVQRVSASDSLGLLYFPGYFTVLHPYGSLPYDAAEELSLACRLAHLAYSIGRPHLIDPILRRVISDRVIGDWAPEVTIRDRCRRIVGSPEIVRALVETELLSTPLWSGDQSVIFFYTLERYRLYHIAAQIILAAAAMLKVVAKNSLRIHDWRSKSESSESKKYWEAVSDVARDYSIPKMAFTPHAFEDHDPHKRGSNLALFLQGFNTILKGASIIIYGYSAAQPARLGEPISHPASKESLPWTVIDNMSGPRLTERKKKIVGTSLSDIIYLAHSWDNYIIRSTRLDPRICPGFINDNLNVAPHQESRQAVNDSIKVLLAKSDRWREFLLLLGLAPGATLGCVLSEDPVITFTVDRHERENQKNEIYDILFHRGEKVSIPPLWDQTVTADQAEALQSEKMWDIPYILSHYAVMRVQVDIEALAIHPMARAIDDKYIHDILLPKIGHSFDVSSSPRCLAIPSSSDFPAPPQGFDRETIFSIQGDQHKLLVLNVHHENIHADGLRPNPAEALHLACRLAHLAYETGRPHLIDPILQTVISDQKIGSVLAPEMTIRDRCRRIVGSREIVRALVETDLLSTPLWTVNGNASVIFVYTLESYLLYPNAVRVISAAATMLEIAAAHSIPLDDWRLDNVSFSEAHPQAWISIAQALDSRYLPLLHGFERFTLKREISYPASDEGLAWAIIRKHIDSADDLNFSEQEEKIFHFLDRAHLGHMVKEWNIYVLYSTLRDPRVRPPHLDANLNIGDHRETRQAVNSSIKVLLSQNSYWNEFLFIVGLVGDSVLGCVMPGDPVIRFLLREAQLEGVDEILYRRKQII